MQSITALVNLKSCIILHGSQRTMRLFKGSPGPRYVLLVTGIASANINLLLSLKCKLFHSIKPLFNGKPCVQVSCYSEEGVMDRISVLILVKKWKFSNVKKKNYKAKNFMNLNLTSCVFFFCICILNTNNIILIKKKKLFVLFSLKKV